MAKKRKQAYNGSPDKDPALKPIYERLRREFTAADLQRYTVNEPGVPLQQVIKQMERIHRDWVKKQRRRRKK